MNRMSRAPAATPGSPAFRPHAGGRREEIEGQYGVGRRRVYWEQEAGYAPPFSISQAREGSERGKGTPRTEEERRSRHEELYPGTKLPPRGTGLSADTGTPAVGATILGLAVITGIAFMAVRKR